MATKIFTNYDLSLGSALSSAITVVADLTLQVTVSGATDNVEVKYTVMGKEGAGDYVPVRNGKGEEVSFATRGNQSYRIAIDDVNSESVKVYALVNGATGVLNIESVKTSERSSLVDDAGISSDVIIRTFAMTVTRPANTTAYAAGDVIGDVSAALTKFVNVAKAAGYGVYVKGVRIQTTDTGLAGKTIKLHFYNDSVTAISDNNAFAIVDANYSKRDGSTTVTMGTGNVAKVGMNNYVDLPLNPVGRDVHCVLETTEGFTPSANSTLIYVYIKCFLTA